MTIYCFCKDELKMLSQKEQLELIILRFIDAHVDLYGEFNVPFIADTFRIHRTTASAIVTKYKKKKPSNLVYDLSKKKYVKGYTFEKVFLMNERSLPYLNAIDVIYSS